jgi:excisionase family DNA binding protein
MHDTATESRPLRVNTVALRLGCSERMVRKLLDEGKLRGWRVGVEWRVSPEAVVEYQQSGVDEAE